MCIKQILKIIGLFLVLFAFLGFFRILGPNAQGSIFGETWWMGNAENWSHLSIGIIMFLSGMFSSKEIQRAVAWIFAFFGIGIAIYSAITQHLLKVNVENPIEEIIYFTLGNIILFSIAKEAREELRSELSQYDRK